MHSKGFTSHQPGKEKLSLGYVWLRLLLGVGSLLGLLLLLQSIATYYHVTRILVTAELRKEAQQQVTAIERESRRLGILDTAALRPLLDEIRRDPPDRIAWIRVIDMSGHVQVHSGNALGEPFVPQSAPQGIEGFTSIPEIHWTKAGKVLVTVLPCGFPGDRPSRSQGEIRLARLAVRPDRVAPSSSLRWLCIWTVPLRPSAAWGPT